MRILSFWLFYSQSSEKFVQFKVRHNFCFCQFPISSLLCWNYKNVSLSFLVSKLEETKRKPFFFCLLHLNLLSFVAFLNFIQFIWNLIRFAKEKNKRNQARNNNEGTNSSCQDLKKIPAKNHFVVAVVNNFPPPFLPINTRSNLKSKMKKSLIKSALYFSKSFPLRLQLLYISSTFIRVVACSDWKLFYDGNWHHLIL